MKANKSLICIIMAAMLSVSALTACEKTADQNSQNTEETASASAAANGSAAEGGEEVADGRRRGGQRQGA